MEINLISLKNVASSIPDPRINRTKKHNLADMVVIAVYAIICGADGWEDIEFIAKERFVFLNQCLNLDNGIPSHDTFMLSRAKIISLLFMMKLHPYSTASTIVRMIIVKTSTKGMAEWKRAAANAWISRL